MTADETLAKRNAEPDRNDPDAGPTSDEAMRDAIGAWTENLKKFEAIRAAERGGRETASALDDLHRLRALGMEAAERNERQARGLLTMAEQDAAARCDTGLRFVKIAQAVRRVVVLEQELMGLRSPPEARASAGSADRTRPSAFRPEAAGLPALPRAGEGREAGDGHEAPDRERAERDDYDDTDDYSDAPYETVIVEIREVLKEAVGPAAPDGERNAVRPVAEPKDGKPFSPTASAGTVGGKAGIREHGPP